MTRFLKISLFFLLFLCPLTSRAETPPLKVVASFSVLADMVRQIGGSDVRVEELVGPGLDAHDFEPSPQDAQKLVGADIVAVNGLKFESWIGRLIKASGTKAKLLVASAGVRPIVLNEDIGGGESLVDPHAWQDPANGKIYLQNIAGALIEARPEKKETFLARARKIASEIKALNEAARKAFADVPDDKRKVITSHDAFAYLGRAYRIKFLAPLGANPKSEPSAASVAHLINTIKKENIKTIFLEGSGSPRLLEQIAHETGARLGGTLYADTLTDKKGEAPTYLAMLRHNIEELLKAMER